MVNFVKIIAVQGNVVSKNKSGDTQLLSGSIKLPSNTKLIFSPDSVVVIQLTNGRIIKIKAKDLVDHNGELQLDSSLFQEFTGKQLSDLEKLESFATDYQNITETTDSDLIRLDDGRVFQRVGKDYVEVAADTFNSENGGGNRFVQLSRVGEDGVADGISPLSLNRVNLTAQGISVGMPVTNNLLTPHDYYNNPFNIENDLNRPPQAINDIYKGQLNTPLVLNPLDKDYDLDGKKIEIISINGQPNLPNTEIDVPNGKVIIDNNGIITFVPDFGFTGLVEFPYVIKDERGATATAKEIITIDPINTNSLIVVSEEGLVNANPDNNGNTDTTDNSIENGKIIVGESSTYTDLEYQLTKEPSEIITSNGQPVTWVLDPAANTITGSANGNKVVELTLDRKTGEYTVVLHGPVDHADNLKEDILEFKVPYQVTDNQRGSVDGEIVVTVEDDSPIALDDIPLDVNGIEVTLVEDDALTTTTGNVLENDSVGADGHARVVSIEY